MSDLEILEQIASDIDSNGWSEYADNIRDAAYTIKRLRDQLKDARHKFALLEDSGQWVNEVYMYDEDAFDALEQALQEEGNG